MSEDWEGVRRNAKSVVDDGLRRMHEADMARLELRRRWFEHALRERRKQLLVEGLTWAAIIGLAILALGDLT